MRNVFLVSYDISCPKRWRKVYKILLGAGDALHYSVFQCSLSSQERVLLLEKLLPVIHRDEDRLLLANLGPVGESANDRVEYIGAPRETPSTGPLIV
jgi:CRISPR-associated protein Cas2